MRKQINIFTLSVALTLLSGVAAQAQLIELSGSADCDGWNTVAALTFPAGVYYTDLDYSMVLTDQTGAEVIRFDWAGTIFRYEDPVMNLMYGQTWGLDLDSEYNAYLVFHFLGEEAVMNWNLVCGDGGNEPEPEVEPCRQAPSFWKNNPDLWPVETLMLGGLEMEKNHLIRILRSPIRGNGSLLLARELIAAKLNVSNGCDDSINSVIEDADNFLIAHPLTESIWRNRVPSSRGLRIELAIYNKAGCPESGVDDARRLSDSELKSATVETTNFSALKAMYR